MMVGIEGPAGAGKSTMARTVAAERRAVVIEGGAWYRALAYEALVKNIDPQNTLSLVKLAKQLKVVAFVDDINKRTTQ